MAAQPCGSPAHLDHIMTVTGDRPALERVRLPDPAVVDAAFTSARAELVGLCRPIVGDDAEDIAHDTYLLARSRVGQLRDPERASAWMARIALNLCFQRHRRLERLKQLLPFLRSQPRDRNPEVKEAVAELPTAQRTVVVLFYGQGLNVSEIAVLLGQKPSTIRSILFRARGRLRLTLGLEDDVFTLGGDASD